MRLQSMDLSQAFILHCLAVAARDFLIHGLNCRHALAVYVEVELSG
jgi:hypothetical protein